MGRPIKQVRYNPCSFRPHIKVSEEFVCKMITHYQELYEIEGIVPQRTNFLNWYSEQVKLFGSDEDSQGIRDTETSEQSKQLFEEWFRDLKVAAHWRESKRKKEMRK